MINILITQISEAVESNELKNPCATGLTPVGTTLKKSKKR